MQETSGRQLLFAGLILCSPHPTATDCFDLTLELSQHKWPPPEQLPELWESNKKSLVQFSLLAAFGGAWGTVRGIDRAGENGAADDAPARPLLAKISVSGISKQLKSSSLGDFYRPLAPGKYSVTAAAEGYQVGLKDLCAFEAP